MLAIIHELSERISRSDSRKYSCGCNFCHLGGYVNKQNMGYWANINFGQMDQRPLYSPKVTMWCAISPAEENGVMVTVTSNRYVEMLEEIFPTTCRIGLGENLVPARCGNGSHFQNVDGSCEETFAGASHFNNFR
ncbi:hypothetical protein Trydic_g22228 [Trypoxylus dichotomus]